MAINAIQSVFKQKTLSLWVAGWMAFSGINTPALAQVDRYSTLSTEQNSVSFLSQKGLVIKLLESNPQILYSEKQVTTADEKVNYEKGAFEPEFYSTMRYDDLYIPNSATEQLSRGTEFYDEQNKSLELGVKGIVETGAEVRVGYLVNQRTSNVIQANSKIDIPELGQSFDIDEDTENSGSVTLSIVQPLLKGLGATALQGNIQLAEAEQRIALAQYKQQVMRSISDALTAYWQLYRAEQIKQIRANAVENARKTLSDIQRRAQAGRSSKKDLLEAQSILVSREADLASVTQGYEEAQTRLKTFINLSVQSAPNQYFMLMDLPELKPVMMPVGFDDYVEQVLLEWPSYLIALQRMRSEQTNLDVALDEKQPALDLSMGYSTHSLSWNEEFKDSLTTKYPSWYVGLNFTVPLQGNERATAKERMALNKMSQVKLDMEAIKVTLSNDLQTRWVQTSKAYQELLKQQQNVALLEELLALEQAHFAKGLSRLTQVYEREDKLNQAKQRYVDSVARYELAKISLKLAEGSLLREYQVNIAMNDAQ